jgi:hypothetical protein
VDGLVDGRVEAEAPVDDVDVVVDTGVVYMA